MFRRIVCLALILSMVVSQMATVPHVHGLVAGDSDIAHASTPHFHLHGGHLHGSKPSHVHSHSHSHAEKACSDKDNLKSVGLLGSVEPVGHDDDAVFVSETVLINAKDAFQKSPRSHFTDLLWSRIAEESFSLHPSTTLRWRPPEWQRFGSDTYLILRNLRI